MKSYYRYEGESDLGEGTVFIEVSEGLVTRQVEVYGTVWLWGDTYYNCHLAELPARELELSDDERISIREFEDVWTRARTEHPTAGKRLSKATKPWDRGR